MIVVMQKGATQAQVDHMVERVEALGLKSHVIVGTERTVIAAIGEKREQMKESLESGSGVAEVVPILAPYKVASREVKPESTEVIAGSLRVGAGSLGIIAGPCSVESRPRSRSERRSRVSGWRCSSRASSPPIWSPARSRSTSRSPRSWDGSGGSSRQASW